MEKADNLKRQILGLFRSIIADLMKGFEVGNWFREKPIHGSELEKHVAVEVTEEPGFAEITQDIALGKRRLFWIENGEQPDSSFWMNFRL